MDSVLEQIGKFRRFIEDYYSNELHEAARKGQKYIYVDFVKLSECDPELATELIDNPEETFKAFEKGAMQIDLEGMKKFKIRITNLGGNDMMIWTARAKDIGKLVRIKGLIVNASDVIQKCVSARFECPGCGNIINILQLSEIYKEPNRCGCGRKGKFIPLDKDTEDYQRLVIQEDLEEFEDRKQPKRKAAMLLGALADPEMSKHVSAGKKVIIYGWLVEKQLKNSTDFTTDILVNNIEFTPSNWASIKLLASDLKKIKEMSQNPTIVKDLAQSINPYIHGHDDVKEALLYSLVGGSHVYSSNGKLIQRGVIHILLIGPPGSGKTAMVKRTIGFVPGGKFTSGKGISGVGLVGCVTFNKEVSQWVLDAGVWPQCNGAAIGIDELDKVGKEDQGYMNNAMEDLVVWITKANIHAPLDTECPVLAAANPIHRIFDKRTPIHKQLGLPRDILDRFDYIFVVDNSEDEEEQRKVIRKIIQTSQQSSEVNQIYENLEVTKYLAYARSIIPILPGEVERFIEDEAIRLMRKPKSNMDTSPEDTDNYISNRLIPTIIRTAKAISKTHLSEKVEVIHAKKAVDILIAEYKSLGCYNKETGQLTIEKIEDFTPRSEIKKYTSLKHLIESSGYELQKMYEVEELEKKAQETLGMDETSFEEAFDKVKRSGTIYEPKRGFFSRI